MTNLDIRSYHKGRTIYTNDFHYYAYTEFEHTAFELYAIKPNCLFFTHFRVTSESANTICKGPLTSARQIGIQRSELVVDNRTHQNKIDHMQQQMVENERSEVYTHTLGVEPLFGCIMHFIICYQYVSYWFGARKAHCSTTQYRKFIIKLYIRLSLLYVR